MLGGKIKDDVSGKQLGVLFKYPLPAGGGAIHPTCAWTTFLQNHFPAPLEIFSLQEVEK